MHFKVIWCYLILWLVYYIALSVATNCFNFNTIGGGKKGWLSTVIQMFFFFLGPEIMIAVQYGAFFSKGLMWTEIHGTGGSIMSVLACIISITNTLTLG